MPSSNESIKFLKAPNIITKLWVRTQIPLTYDSGMITDLLQNLSHVFLLSRISIRKPTPFMSNAIYVGRWDIGASIEPYILITVVIRKFEHKVRIRIPGQDENTTENSNSKNSDRETGSVEHEPKYITKLYSYKTQEEFPLPVIGQKLGQTGRLFPFTSVTTGAGGAYGDHCSSISSLQKPII